MDIINVITYHNDVGIEELKSFAVTDPQLQGEVAEEAEAYFVEQALKIAGVTDDVDIDVWREEAEESIEDGYIEINGTYIYLVWSHPENIPDVDWLP